MPNATARRPSAARLHFAIRNFPMAACHVFLLLCDWPDERSVVRFLTSVFGDPLMARRFEFVGGTSAKFWEIDTRENQVIVRFGRVGTNGQTQTKTLADPAAAAKHAGK